MRGNETVSGHPVRVYDNGGASIDRYTVFYMDTWRHESSYGCGTDSCERCHGRKLYALLGMNGAPFWPQGFCQHSEGFIGRHNGRRIPFASLPEDCRKAVLQDLADLAD